MACSNCNTAIKGANLDNPLGGHGFRPPNYCPNCGRPFPWTNARLAVAAELAADQTNLTEAERTQLIESIDILVKETPAVPLATARFKRLMEKIGREGASAFRDILVDILSEAVKKAVFPP